MPGEGSHHMPGTVSIIQLTEGFEFPAKTVFANKLCKMVSKMFSLFSYRMVFVPTWKEVSNVPVTKDLACLPLEIPVLILTSVQ